MAELALSISGLRKVFERKIVLDNVSFNVKSGIIFGLVGLNGIGKTTIIKIILDLLNQDSGTAKIFGVDSSVNQARKGVIYLPEKFHPSPFLKGWEFLRITSELNGGRLNKEKVLEVAKNMSLNVDSLNLKISKYSKGMVQKLGLIAVFSNENKLAILDEPMSGLDPRARIELKRQLMEFKNNGGTVFFSSHILSDIDEICDEFAIIHNTKIVYNGTPSEFKAKYNEPSLEKAYLNIIEA